MRIHLFYLLLIHFLTWSGDADRRPNMRRRARPGRLSHESALDKERVLGRLRTGFGSALAVHSPGHGGVGTGEMGGVQAVEAVPVFTQGRRAKDQGLLGSTKRGSNMENEQDMQQDEGFKGRVTRMPSNPGSPNLLASFAGKNRVLVISAPHDSDGYYRLMMSLLKPDVYCELAERHVHQIVMFHQEGEMGGKVRRISSEGKVLEEPLDTALIPRLMSFLKLEKGKEI